MIFTIFVRAEHKSYSWLLYANTKTFLSNCILMLINIFPHENILKNKTKIFIICLQLLNNTRPLATVLMT